MRYRNRNDPWEWSDWCDDDGNLSMIHDYQYIDNEVSENTRGGQKTVHRTFNVPHDGLLTGTVYVKGVPVQVFQMDRGRKVTPKEPALEPHSPTLLVTGQGYDTGVIVMEWSRPVEANEVRLVMSYEYYLGDEWNVLF